MYWTVVAYKPASADYCRGCHMASYSSDFELEKFSERGAVVEFVAEIMFRNTQLDINEAGYDIHVLSTEAELEYGILLSPLLDDAKEVMEAKLESHNLAQAAERKKKREIEYAAQEKSERAKLVALKEKYPD